MDIVKQSGNTLIEQNLAEFIEFRKHRIAAFSFSVALCMSRPCDHIDCIHSISSMYSVEASTGAHTPHRNTV